MKIRFFTLFSSAIMILLSSSAAYGYAGAESSNEGVSFFSSLMKFIGFLVVFGVVIFLAYYTTRIVANKSNQGMKSENIEVIDFISLSTTSKIMMVKIERYVYILAVNGSNVTSIDRLNYDELDIEEKDFYYGNFDQQLKNIMNSGKLTELKGKFSKKRDGR